MREAKVSFGKEIRIRTRNIREHLSHEEMVRIKSYVVIEKAKEEYFKIEVPGVNFLFLLFKLFCLFV